MNSTNPSSTLIQLDIYPLAQTAIFECSNQFHKNASHTHTVLHSIGVTIQSAYIPND